MVNRTEADIDIIITDINNRWKLNVDEEEVLESVFYLFLALKTEKIKQIELLINDETEELLETFNDREVINYVTYNWDFVAPDDESGLEDALDNLNFKWIDAVDVDDMVDYLEDCGYTLQEYDKNCSDIVIQSQLEELTDKFLKMSISERDNLIKNL